MFESEICYNMEGSDTGLQEVTKMRIFVAVLAILAVVAVCEGRTITVDDDGAADFSTIQAGIDDSNDGDTVLVADGTYTGDGNRDIDFHGKAITVISENGPKNCIIDCNGTEADPHRGFNFHSGEDACSAVIGFTITNGYAPRVCFYRPPDWPCFYLGGGILCKGSSPTISHCRITGNRAEYGGGIYSYDGNPIISHCTISGNHAEDAGGIELWESNPIISNCTFSDNSVEGEGGAVYSSKSNPLLTNCTFVGNSGGALYHFVYDESSPMLTNCLLWGNGREIYIRVYQGSGSVTARYCDIAGGWPGEGNIDADPCFADPNNGDYHVKSQGGRWDANEGRWTTDEATSPCINAGDPRTPIGLEPFPNGGIINMGAYGGTAEASKSWFGEPRCEVIVAGDVNGDCRVDFLDFRLMALHWFEDR